MKETPRTVGGQRNHVTRLNHARNMQGITTYLRVSASSTVLTKPKASLPLTKYLNYGIILHEIGIETFGLEHRAGIIFKQKKKRMIMTGTIGIPGAEDHLLWIPKEVRDEGAFRMRSSLFG